MSCSKVEAECGQGWYKQVLPDLKGVRGRLATFEPILRWRVCSVWNRLRQPGGETRKDGTLVSNQPRMGPIPAGAPRCARPDPHHPGACHVEADRLGRPHIDLLNAEEARIRELMAAGPWLKRWTGDKPTADVPLDAVFSDGSGQPLLIGAEA